MTATFGFCGFVVVVCGIARSRWVFWFSVLLRGFVRFVAVWGGFGLGVLGLGGNFCGFRFVGFVGMGCCCGVWLCWWCLLLYWCLVLC